jgi:ring-1,2-phenylacetyl-CoA epoxidase subunit PaaE
VRLHTLQVSEVESVTDDSVAITFDVPAELRDDFDFAHGQHLVLARDRLRRTYSICSPAGSGRLRVAVKRLPGGEFSSWAHSDLRPGDRLDVMTPGGSFTTPLDPANRKRYAAIAAGSGITPILSIIATILEREPRSEVALLYGNRTSRSIMFLEELEDLKDRHPERVELFHVLSREPQAVELLSGRLDRERLARFFDSLLPMDEVDEWFLCGPLEMIESARDLLLERGVAKQRIHREVFHVEGEPVRAARPADDPGRAEEAATVTVRLDGRESAIAVHPSGETVLDALVRVRGDAPYACKGGVCGTCRARVVQGSVRMDRCYALEDAEVDAGIVLTCQAHPTSPSVTLDFDR